MTRTGELKREESSIIALQNFIQATRDSGYKGTASAVSELVDNALQAKASRIEIGITTTAGPDGGCVLSILDNGVGMDPFTLRQALRFGGTTRFGDRSGLGRYGMGLPNASLSQARRVSVFTWQSGSARMPPGVYSCYLDVDEIASGKMTAVPRPEITKSAPPGCSGRSGTLVTWTQCDRLEHRRVSSIERRLASELGRRFRHFIWGGTQLAINGVLVRAIDPLCVHADSEFSGARVFGREQRYEVRRDPGGKETGWVRITFSELPVHEWYRLSNDEKRRRGISKGAGVSIVRGGREVDYGWFFMGGKRRENYDDWWRCEIQFDPVLDEAFGITHTKQQVRPQPHLVEALSPDIEATARALNGRARKAHLAARATERFSRAEAVASERDHLLRPLPAKPAARASELMRELERSNPSLRSRAKSDAGEQPSHYRIVEGTVRDASFFRGAYDGDRLVVVLNQEHPFYREVYSPLLEDDSPAAQQLRSKIELVLIAAARAEATLTSTTSQDAMERFRHEWSNAMATYLND